MSLSFIFDDGEPYVDTESTCTRMSRSSARTRQHLCPRAERAYDPRAVTLLLVDARGNPAVPL